MNQLRRRRSWLVIVGSVALVASGCGGSDGDGSSTEQPSGTKVTAALTEFSINLSQQDLQPGTYTFVAENTGEATHALEIEGAGIEESTDTLAPGESANLVVELPAGSYVLYCPVANHRDQGMQLQVTVGGGGADTSSPTSGPASQGGGY